MPEIESHLKRVHEKLQQLLKQHQLLQQENNTLKVELSASKKKNVVDRAEVEMLEQKLAVLKIATGQINETDKKELEKRLNHYLKEIDRCITMLDE